MRLHDHITFLPAFSLDRWHFSALPETLTFSDTIGIVGLLVTVLGFVIAVRQINKTHTAAEAAKAATVATVNSFRRFESMTNLQKIAAQTKVLHDVLVQTRIEASASAAVRLREMVAELEGHPTGPHVNESKRWPTMKENIWRIEADLSRAQSINRLDADNRIELLARVSATRDEFITLASKTAMAAF
ncbi:hypothetical protein RBI14_05090 [Alcaligenaceae bacterium B3P038]|nr:hypothetical protein [Alcaligenaceae bacterium B3P038]